MSKNMIEKERTLAVARKADVIVAGGGSAGLGAAVAAARNGVKTLLIERYGFLGGQATAGMVGTIGGGHENLREGKDPSLLIKGILEEFIKRLQAVNGATEPVVFENRTFLVPYDPVAWKDIAEEMILEAGADILYHTFIVDTIMEDNIAKGVIIENKSGRSAVLGKVVIDATGDADVAYFAGVPCKKGEGGKVQFPSMMFRMANVDTSKALSFPTEKLWKLLKSAMDRKEFDVPRYDGYILASPRPNEVTMNITTVTYRGANFDAVNADHLTWGEIEGRRQVREYARFLKKYVPGFEDAFVNDVAPQVGIRETRTIQGEYELTFDDVSGLKKFDDGIARYAWPLEQHQLDHVEWSEYPTDYYEIPYRCLIPKKVDQLLVVGRCISLSHRAQGAARGTSLCMAEGQAAGTATAISIKNKISPRKIDVHLLQKALVEQGANITVYPKK